MQKQLFYMENQTQLKFEEVWDVVDGTTTQHSFDVDQRNFFYQNNVWGQEPESNPELAKSTK